MRVDIGPRSRALIAAAGFTLFAAGFLLGAMLGVWVKG